MQLSLHRRYLRIAMRFFSAKDARQYMQYICFTPATDGSGTYAYVTSPMALVVMRVSDDTIDKPMYLKLDFSANVKKLIRQKTDIPLIIELVDPDRNIGDIRETLERCQPEFVHVTNELGYPKVESVFPSSRVIDDYIPAPASRFGLNIAHDYFSFDQDGNKPKKSTRVHFLMPSDSETSGKSNVIVLFDTLPEVIGLIAQMTNSDDCEIDGRNQLEKRLPILEHLDANKSDSSTFGKTERESVDA